MHSVYSWISHDVTVAMLVSQNNEMAAMLVSWSNPPGIERYCYANVFFCFRWKTWLLITWVKPKSTVGATTTEVEKNKKVQKTIFLMTGNNYASVRSTRASVFQVHVLQKFVLKCVQSDYFFSWYSVVVLWRCCLRSRRHRRFREFKATFKRRI